MKSKDPSEPSNLAGAGTLSRKQCLKGREEWLVRDQGGEGEQWGEMGQVKDGKWNRVL